MGRRTPLGGGRSRCASLLDAKPWRGDGQLTAPRRRRRRGSAGGGAPAGGARQRTRGLRTEHHRSAGGLVVRGSSILLIATQKGRRWQLPKGHIEQGETAEEAAIREVREETGVTGRIVAPLPGVEYWYVEKGPCRVHKTVDYFLLHYASGDAADFDPEEVSGTGWFGWEAGIARLTFDNERRVAQRAWEIMAPPGDEEPADASAPRAQSTGAPAEG